jgi:hypothetical protein
MLRTILLPFANQYPYLGQETSRQSADKQWESK